MTKYTGQYHVPIKYIISPTLLVYSQSMGMYNLEQKWPIWNFKHTNTLLRLEHKQNKAAVNHLTFGTSLSKLRLSYPDI